MANKTVNELILPGVNNGRPENNAVNYRDFELLCEQGGLENAMVQAMITKAKRKYVDTHHTQKISQMHSSTYKDGWWKTYVYVDGKRKEIVRKTEEDLYSSLYDFYRALEEAPKTFADAVNLLMDRKENQLNRSHNTIVDNRRYLSYPSIRIQTKPLSEVSEEELRKWLAKEYMPTKPKETALRKTLQLLKELFRYGISQKLCSSNPAEYILFDDYVKDCDHSKKTAEERAFSEEELAILWEDALKTPTKPRALMTLLAMETGLRAGELAALHISDIQDDFIHVHRQQLRDTATGHQLFHFVDYTKDERKHPHDGRYVPITSACAKVLELARQLPGNSKYLFHDKAGNAISKDSYEQNLRRRCARLGIETHHNHAFRVAFNSRLIEMGFSPAERAYILGHAVETNERNYSVTDTRRRYDMRDRIREQEKKSNEQGKKSEKMVEVSNDFHRMASQKGFEPPTSPLGGARSIQLSY